MLEISAGRGVAERIWINGDVDGSTVGVAPGGAIWLREY